MVAHRTSTQNPGRIVMLLGFCLVFSRVALVVEANISFLLPYMRTKPYIAMRDVLNAGAKAASYRPTTDQTMANNNEKNDEGFVYAENFYDPQIVMDQLKNEKNNVLNQRIQTPDSSSALSDALLSEQAYSMANQAGMENTRELRATTSLPAFVPKTQVQENRYNHNCFFSPMNCRMWKETLPVVDDASQIELGDNGRLADEGTRAVMVRSTRQKWPFQLRPQPSIWRIFTGS